MHQTEKEAIGLPVKLWSVSRRLRLKNHSPTDALTIKQLASWPYLSGGHYFWVRDMSLHANADGYRYLATPLFIWQLVLDKNKEMWPCYFVRLVTKTHVGGHQCRSWQQICLSDLSLGFSFMCLASCDCNTPQYRQGFFFNLFWFIWLLIIGWGRIWTVCAGHIYWHRFTLFLCIYILC